MLRDFSNSSKQNLLGLVSQVENEKWSDFTDWIGDRWFDFEDWIGQLNINKYINDVNSYHKKVIDKNNATKKSIESIFTKVQSVDCTYGSIFNNIGYTLKNIQQYINQMNQIVSPSNGKFEADNIKSSLENIVSEIQSCNVQNLKEQMVQDIGGELIFNEKLIYEYIKKEPNELSDEEKEMLVDVLAELEDITSFYGSLVSKGNDELGIDVLHRISWLSDSEKYDSFTGVSTHYNDIYVNLLNFIMEQNKDENTFAASLLKLGNEDSNFNVLGVEWVEKVGKLFGNASLTAYTAKYVSEHTEQYFGKLEASEKEKLTAGGKFGKVNDAIEKWLEKKDLYTQEKDTVYTDMEGNEIKNKKDIPDFYKKELTLGEVNKNIGISASLYEGAFDFGDAGDLDVVIGNAEAHGSISAGLYVSKTDKDGNTVRVFSPGVDAEIGASVTALEVDYDVQILGDENFGLNADATVSVGKAEAKAEASAKLYDENGNLNFELGAGASAEAIAAEAKGSIGVNILGGEVGVNGSVNFGIGAHADVGYKDGVFKFDVGASLGLGVSFGAEIDIGGMVDTVCDKVEVVWDGVKDAWDSIWNK